MQGNTNTSCDCSARKRGFWISSVRGGHYFYCRKRGATKDFSWVFGPYGRSKWIAKEMLSSLSSAGVQEGVNPSSRSQMGMRKQNARKGNVAWTCEPKRHMLFWAVLLRGQQRSRYSTATGRTWRCLDAGHATLIYLCVTLVLGGTLLMWARGEGECRNLKASTLFCNNQDAETRTSHPTAMPSMFTPARCLNDHEWQWRLKSWPRPKIWGGQQRQQLLLLPLPSVPEVGSKQVCQAALC